MQMQPNTGGSWHLALGGFEIYGKLKKVAAKPPATPTNRFAVIELLSCDGKQQQALMEGLIGYEMPLDLELAAKSATEAAKAK